MSTTPHVSIVTPVFNGEKYLTECIESVLAQTYCNWDYTIVDNRSTDRSPEIAQRFANRDSRIRVINNEQFVGAIENHNAAFRAISHDSVYCKLVSADDWLYPECISRLVDVAELHPNVGLVGSYSINASGVKWTGLSCDNQVFPGHEICKLFLLGCIDTFWVPSTVLYRSSLVRTTDTFFPGNAPSADLSAALNCLTVTDFGFVHQILSFERIHEESITGGVRKLGSYLLDRVEILKEYGPRFLSGEENEHRMETLLTEYYHNVLATACLNSRDRQFWAFHSNRLNELGYSLFDKRLVKGLSIKMLDLVLNPKQTIEKIIRRYKVDQQLKGT